MFVVAYRPAWTGISFHTWLSIAILVPLLVHLVVNWEWAVRIARTFTQKLFSTSRLNFVVDLPLMVAAVAVMVSGFMVSPSLLAPFGIHTSNFMAWHYVHAWSADATMLLLAVHLLLHGNWFASTVSAFLASRKPGLQGTVVTLAEAVAPATRPKPLYDKHGNRRSHVGWRRQEVAKQRSVVVSTGSVLALSTVVAVLIAVSVAVAGPKAPTVHGAAQAAKGQRLQVCPSTGCTAASCHAASGESAAVFYGTKRVSAYARSAARVHATALSSSSKLPSSQQARTPVKLIASTSRALVSVPGSPKKSPPSAGSTSRTAVVAPAHRSISSVQVCPVSGCARVTCHGAHGTRPGPWYATHS